MYTRRHDPMRKGRRAVSEDQKTCLFTHMVSG
jgi:hypothetical protein